MKKNTLVAYFSCSGSTRTVARTLADVAGADLFEIRPEISYSSAEPSWMDQQAGSTVELNDLSSRPASAEKLDNMADYEVIFLGIPVWLYMVPSIINGFLESYDFSGKTIVVFATSSSEMEQPVTRLNNRCSGVIKGERLLNGRLSKEELSAWAGSFAS